MSASSPIDALVKTAPQEIRAVLAQRSDLVKLGLKGPGLAAWASSLAIELPDSVYACLPVGDDGVLARVGSAELIIECTPADPLLQRLESALAEATGVYRLEQQALTLVLQGDYALPVLAQTCGIELEREPVNRVLYTRVAGASCAIIPRLEGDQRLYRLWIDYTLAHYMWETLAAIVDDVRCSA